METVERSPDDRKRAAASFGFSLAAHAALFLAVTFVLRMTTVPLPLLTEVSLTGAAVPRGAGSETSLSPPRVAARPAPEAGAAARDPESATVPVTDREGGEKTEVRRPQPTARRLTPKEIRARYLRRFGGARGVPRTDRPPSETEELPAGTGEGGTLGVPTGTEITGDILSRGVLSLEKPVCRERLPTVYEVTLLISVASDGRVLDNIKVQGIVSRSELVHVSIEAIKKWKFQPLPASVGPVIQTGTITFKFVPE